MCLAAGESLQLKDFARLSLPLWIALDVAQFLLSVRELAGPSVTGSTASRRSANSVSEVHSRWNETWHLLIIVTEAFLFPIAAQFRLVKLCFDFAGHGSTSVLSIDGLCLNREEAWGS